MGAGRWPARAPYVSRMLQVRPLEAGRHDLAGKEGLITDLLFVGGACRLARVQAETSGWPRRAWLGGQRLCLLRGGKKGGGGGSLWPPAPDGRACCRNKSY